MARVLVVDDEPQILRALRINLRVRGYDVDRRTWFCSTWACRTWTAST